ncbi:MAG: hypothetical protein LQ347_006250, partial [Umbilicaria vellea]
HIQMYQKINDLEQQLRHHLLKSAVISAASSKLKITSVNLSHSSDVKAVTVVSVITVTTISSVMTDDLMNLSSVIAAVQEKPLFISEIKEICNK